MLGRREMQLSKLCILVFLGACVTAYADINSLVFDATGKNAHDVLDEDDLDRIRDKVRQTRSGDFQRIYDYIDDKLRTRNVDAGITPEQQHQFLDNLQIVRDRIMEPERARRQREAKSKLLWPNPDE